MSATRQLQDIERVGGHPAIDFVNTVSAWNTDQPADYLADFDDFLRWNEMLGLLGRTDAAHFRARPAPERHEAYIRVSALRDSLHRVLAARAAGEPLPQAALDDLNAVIRETVAWRRIAADSERGCSAICCTWDMRQAPAIAALGPVAWKAAELLERGDLDRVKECPGASCAWLFLDTSKNRSRQWCSMKTCGNTAKVRRFRERQGG